MNRDPFEALHDISAAVARATQLEEIYEIILNEIVALMGVERASIMRLDPKNQVLRIVAAKGMDASVWKSIEIAVGEGVSGKVWQEGKPLLIRKIQTNPRYKTHSYMVAPVTAFPMKVGEVPVGLINLTDKKSGRPFTEADLKLLTLISHQVASYMHIYDLVERVKSGEAAKLQLEVAREIQQRLLPRKPPRIPGLDIASQLWTAERVGADYYDFLPTCSESFGFCIADVSGHSVGGALLASAIRSFLRAEINNRKDPAGLVEAANKTLFSDLSQAEQFISLFFALYHPEEKMLRFTNAGHNPPLLVRAGGERQEFLVTQDSLLGIDPGLSFHEKRCRLYGGDVLVLYTDGLTEALGMGKERFGLQRVVNVVREKAEKNASELLESLLGVWKEFLGKKPPQDDMTLMVMKVV